MDTTIQTYTVQPVALPIVPCGAPNLPETAGVDAAFNVASGQMSVTMTFMLPGTINPSQVTIQQYYPAVADPSKLYFYAVYNSDSTATAKPVNCAFKASPVDSSGGAISLGSVLTINTMLVNLYGPKSSRGMNSAVRTTEQ
ncbi:hypothetical protein [Fluviicola sp.]|uniref:hypothetical protein n=1 Tax=Fluviicola sp. TaxID=1917219 RepID=UPI0031E284D9